MEKNKASKNEGTNRLMATILRKPCDVQDWHRRYDALPQEERDSDECVVELSIELTAAEFETLSQDLLNDNEVIRAHTADMWREGDVWHCLELTCPAYPYKILVESEGSYYARYAALVARG